MKIKLWLFSRIFWAFSILIIFLLNFILYFSYYFTEKTYLDNIKKSIYSQYETIKTFIDINNSDYFSLPIWQVKQLNQLGLYFDVKRSDTPLKTMFVFDKDLIFFQTYYHGYNIVIWKKLTDLQWIKKVFIENTIYINLVSIFLVFILSYLITKWTIKPFEEIISFLKDYKFWEDKLLENKYIGTDIWKLIDSINYFIVESNKVYKNQKEFVQDMSHEIKTPLMQILSTIDLLENRINDEKALKKLSDIKNVVYHLSDLVSKLNFIQENKELVYKEEDIDLYEYISSIVSTLQDLLDKKHIKVEINEIEKCRIKSNKYYLERLFINLLTNAIVYNKENGKIFINIYKNKIEIEDTWIWIKEEDLPKIFDRFYRWGNNKIYSNGTWLWLSVVKKSLDILSWKVEVFSKEWEGTKFVLYC